MLFKFELTKYLIIAIVSKFRTIILFIKNIYIKKIKIKKKEIKTCVKQVLAEVYFPEFQQKSIKWNIKSFWIIYNREKNRENQYLEISFLIVAK